ncbi:Frataxin-like domain-containing protein [Mucor mucedo]|uniref:Frataxin-like domain-containing protein n=1 Tax=Mucor mucedo TaxID=29922 RepID=UPI00221E8C43|nr:Frataxin-like domain-containing protein [Mucor mucedo]KAI7864790.1 Frataxin-like domain-containing protein [Mucor mucedo]
MFRNIARHALIPTWRRSVAVKAHVPLVRMRVMQPLIRPFHMSLLSPNQNYSITDLTTERYHRLSDELLEHMCMKLEELADETDMKGFDVEYNQGVMTISVGDHGTYVINKQPPNHQIWLSSPVSGPQRYDFDEKNHKWFYHRDNHTLDDVLNSELSKAMGEKIDLLEGFEPQEK